MRVSIIITYSQHKQPLESINQIIRGCIAKEYKCQKTVYESYREVAVKEDRSWLTAVSSVGVQLGVNFPLIKKHNK